MRPAAALISLLVLSACSEPGPLITRGPVPAAEETIFVVKSTGPTEADIAHSARQFMFSVVDTYLETPNVAPGSYSAQMLGLMGREDLIEAADIQVRLPACARRWVSPVRIIRESARNTQIVIISEANDQPRHREFIAQAVEGLHEDGFTIFASHALNFTNGTIDDPVAPLLTEGFLVREPIYGRLLRKAKALNMRIVPFKPTPSELMETLELPLAEQVAKQRDMQIENIVTRIFDKNADAKVIIHISNAPVFPEDISENGTAPDANWMETRLLEETGINALTVSQTDCYAPIGQSVAVPRLGNGQRGYYDSDLMVGHRAEAFASKRPNWRRAAGDQDVQIPDTFKSVINPVIIEARRAGDPDLAVPVDRVLVLPDETLSLLLPVGEFRLEAWTKNGPIAEPVSVVVAE